MPRTRFLLPLLVVFVALPTSADEKKPAPPTDGFVPMFNGKDLSGWVNVNCHPDTFFVKDDEVVTTGKPTGFLRTERQYENFELEMDWMHVNKTEVGNSGLFVWGDPIPAVGSPYTRGIEVQVLVNLEYRDKKTDAITATSHGDLFSIWGAKCLPDRPHPLMWERCLPSENRAKGGGEWNHYKVIANDGVIKLHVNGKEVSGVSKCTPRKGYLALESEGAECHFKNVVIKELPSTNPKPEEVAKVAEGYKSLFNGLDLKGWKTQKDAWKVAGGKLVAVSKNGGLSCDKVATRNELIFDWNVPAKNAVPATCKLGPVTVVITPRGDVLYTWKEKAEDKPGSVETKAVKSGGWNRATILFDGKTLAVAVNGQEVVRADASGAVPDDRIGFLATIEGLEIMNVFVRELKENK